MMSNSWLPNGDSNGHRETLGPAVVDVLIIGTGPAGAALACFLSSYGIRGLMVSAASSSANTPRAHITNMAALECLRDIGLDAECEKLGTEGDCMMHTRWCHSMAGEEFGRIYSWGNDPRRKGDYDAASPCKPLDLPQTLLEPTLVRYATLHGFTCRFDTSFVEFVDNGPNGVVTILQDNVTGSRFQIHSRYLFGADGARSRVVKQLNLPLQAKPAGGIAINILVKADLTRLVEHRKGNLHWIIQPDKPHCDFGWMGIVRMVKPWHEWMFILFPKPGIERPEPTTEEYLTQVKSFIGDDSIPAEILGVSKWFINETVAEQYSRSNVFCLGDAVHRHPPFNGLGSNTCIQDAFNLAWKVAYVLQNRAAASLLETYGTERQPVGHSVITRANEAFREHLHVWEALSILPDEISQRKAILAELSSATIAGQKRRAALKRAILHTSHEFHGLGIEMGQRYSGTGIFTADEQHEYVVSGLAAEDSVLYYSPSTYPGCRLPHAWLNKPVPVKPISTIDLAGKGAFSIFTGIGGDNWRAAGEAVSKNLGIKIRVHSVGFRQEWEYVYGDWADLSEVGESGAVFVRPDRFVAWRSQHVLSDESQCEQKLASVMRSILGL